MASPAATAFLTPAAATAAESCQFWRDMDALYATPAHSPLHHDSRCGTCRPHTCRTQCDSCHDVDNCVPATHRYDDLTLCAGCYRAAVYLDGYPSRVRYFED